MHISQQIAADAVNQVLSGRNLTLALPAAMSLFNQATPQQRGAAADLSYGTLRFYAEIDAYLDQLLDKPLTDKRIYSLLLVALYQLLHDRADTFTVVNQAVTAVSMMRKPAAKPWAKGLVNAVLRNFLRQKDTLAQSVNQSEAVHYSYPHWWIDKLKFQYPDLWQSMLTAGNMHPPMTLRVNLAKIDMAQYLALLAQHDMAAEHLGGEAILLAQPVPVEKIPGFAEGLVSVQDYGAQFAAHLLDLKDGMKVLDACAAPGGKTGHILEMAKVKLTAIDNDSVRLQRVASNLQRLGLQAALVGGDAASTEWHDGELFDRILADVPCSASGIVRRHVDIKWLRREEDLISFAAQQAGMLPNLWQRLAKGGKLLYVTCSVFNEENQQQVDKFLAAHSDAEQIPLPVNVFPDNVTRVNGQLVPCHAHDGFFYALLQKH